MEFTIDGAIWFAKGPAVLAVIGLIWIGTLLWKLGSDDEKE